MTDEEKAKNYFEDSKDYYDSREPITDRQLRQIYLDGLAEGRKEKCLEQNKDGTIRPCEVMKENEELKKENEQLKTQIEKMKRCFNFAKWLFRSMNEMTDEEKAEEYMNKIDLEQFDNYFNSVKLCEQAYLDGMAEGKPKWHDLRKDPNDLPSSKNSNGTLVLLAYKSVYCEEIVVKEYIYIDDKGFIDLVDYYSGDYRELPYFKKEGVLIAWCELPKFEEESK